VRLNERRISEFERDNYDAEQHCADKSEGEPQLPPPDETPNLVKDLRMLSSVLRLRRRLIEARTLGVDTFSEIGELPPQVLPFVPQRANLFGLRCPATLEFLLEETTTVSKVLDFTSVPHQVNIPLGGTYRAAAVSGSRHLARAETAGGRGRENPEPGRQYRPSSYATLPPPVLLAFLLTLAARLSQLCQDMESEQNQMRKPHPNVSHHLKPSGRHLATQPFDFHPKQSRPYAREDQDTDIILAQSFERRYLSATLIIAFADRFRRSLLTRGSVSIRQPFPDLDEVTLLFANEIAKFVSLPLQLLLQRLLGGVVRRDLLLEKADFLP